MLCVILRDGRVLKYNKANHLHHDEDAWTLRTSLGGDWVATINPDVIERVDSVRPCDILREVRDRKRMKIY